MMTLRSLQTVGITLALFTTATVGPVWSQDGGSRWIVRGAVLGLFSTGDEAGVLTFEPELTAGESARKGISDGVGLGLDLEYLAWRRVGVELAALFGDFGFDLVLDTGESRLTRSDDIGLTALSLGVNYHFTPDARTDFFAGVFAESSSYDDLTFQFPEADRSAKLSLDDDVGFGFRVGLDWQIKPEGPWLLAIGLRHLRGPLDVKPIVLSIGAGYRF